MQCQANCKNGKRCTNKTRKGGEFCGLHKECPICYDNKRVISFPCGHEICQKCADKWLEKNTTCHMCRKVVKDRPAPSFVELALMALYLDPDAAIEGRSPDINPTMFAMLAQNLGIDLNVQ